jgi:GTP-binding protein
MDAEFVKSVYHLNDLPRDGKPQIAVAGRSNVGKSSMLNKLVGRKKLAKVSGTPGKTRCLNIYLLDEKYYFVDLPGYGFARVSKTEQFAWSELTAAYLERPDVPQALVCLFDARRTPDATDIEWWAWLKEHGKPFLPVLTKADKLSGNGRQKSLREFTRVLPDGPAPVWFSAVNGTGKKAILNWIFANT